MPTTRKSKTAKSTTATEGHKNRRKSSTSTRKTTSRSKTASSANGSGKKTVRPRANGAAGKATTSTRKTTRARSEKAPVKELAVQTAQDYHQAKKALGQLWEDVAKTTYSAFSTIATNVEKRYAKSRQAISEVDVRYALEKTGDKLKSIKGNASQNVQQMGRQVKLLYQMLKDMTAGKFKAPWATVAAITAALLYFISPIDVLPDFIPGAGLIDDALVLSLCISVIRMDLRRYAKENDLDLADYGLAKR